MTADFQIRRFLSFETAPDGTTARLSMEDQAGDQISIVLTIEQLTMLIMTLPGIASNAVKRLHNDPNMRITYPLTDFQLELSPGNARILTVGTLDGFHVSFTLTEEFSEELGRAHLKRDIQYFKPH